MEEDDELYGDLSATTLPPPSVARDSKRQEEQQQPPCPNSTPSNHMLQELSEENQRLKRNIGTLYRTAKAELKRKNDEIKRLTSEIETLKKMK
jgi:hypothetical protein